MTAPIVIFVYNRPEHTRTMLEYLSRCEGVEDSIVYIFSDGPKEKAAPDTLKKIEDVRRLIRSKKWGKEINIIEEQSNKGIYSMMTEGMTRVVSQHGSMIVLEDDILPSKYFLSYCNKALEKYKNDEQVMAISGFMFPINRKNLPETFFLRTGMGWGWATWKRAWDQFNPDSGYLINQLENQNQVGKFNFNDTYFFFQILKGHHEGTLTAWDACWYATIYLNNGLSLHPAKTLTQNFGMDGSGTHYTSSTKSRNEELISFERMIADTPMPALTDQVELNLNAEKALENYFRKLNFPDIFTRIINKLRRTIS